MLNNKELTDIEWTTCWMAIRYAMNRQSIASATLPADLVKEYWYRWSDYQKEMIVNDLKSNYEDNSFGRKPFGNENIDKPNWMKFWKACDTKNHFTAIGIDDISYTVFETNGRIYPLKSYINEPHNEIFFPKENIKEIIK